MDTAACKNKGFILDGYPRSYNDAKSIFLQKLEGDATEDVEPSPTNPFPGFKIIEDTLPQYVILFQGEDG